MTILRSSRVSCGNFSPREACRKRSAYCDAVRGQGSAALLRLRLAHTFPRRAAGLFLHGRLASHEGLWIKPCSAIHSFGLSYAIDVVFLDAHGWVLKTVHALQPNRVAWCRPAYSVIELSAFYCRRNSYYQAALRRAMRALE